MKSRLYLLGLVLALCMPLSHSQSQPASTVAVQGQSAVINATRQISGNVSGTALQNARTGTDFHIIVSNLPSDKPLQLDLGFAEIENKNPGQRLFNVDVNGKRALTSFDVVSEAGGPFRSVVKRFTITPTDGRLDFRFTATTGEAIINYIQITGNGVERLIAMPSPQSASATMDDDFISADQLAPFDAEEGLITLDGTRDTWNSGVPVGGIGTGKFELLPNGQFGNFTINNSWDLPVLRPQGTFVAIAAKVASRRGGARLVQVKPTNSRGEAIYKNHTNMTRGKYSGNFPFGQVEFDDDTFPLTATIESWSPLIPHNTDDSSLPAAVVNVIVKNPQKYPVAVGVAFSWEDINGRGGSLLPGDQHGYSTPSQHQDAETTGIKGFQITSPALPQGRSATFTGDYFVGTPIKSVGITRNLAWNPRTESIPWWNTFVNNLRLTRIPSSPATVAGKSGEGPMASTLCVSFNLAPNETRRVPFIVAWHLPRIVTMDSTSGQASEEATHSSERFDSAIEIASYLASHRHDFYEQTKEWVEMIERATVPRWLKTHALNSLFPLRSNSILLRNSRFAMLDSPADMKGMLGPADLKLGSSDFTLTMFPALERTELNLYARAQDADTGRIPRYVGNIHGALAGFDRELLGTDWYDPTSSWLLGIARYWRETGDDATLDALRPAIIKARDYVVTQLQSASEDAADNVFSAFGNLDEARAMSRLKAAAALRTTQEILGESSEAINQLIQTQIEQVSLTGESTFAPLLSGIYAARAAGATPIMDDDTINRYLDAVHEQNFDDFKPVPLMSSTQQTVGQRLSALAPLQSYIGALGLQSGAPEVGISPYVRMFQVAYGAQKAPWKQALLYNAPAASQPSLRYSRSAMSAWSIWRGLSGVIYDKPNQRLLIKPTSITTSTLDMEIPVFTADFWGWLQYNAAESTGTLAITRVTAETTPSLLSIASTIAIDGAPRDLVTFTEPFEIETGASLEFDGWPARPSGTVTPRKYVPPVIVEDDETTGTLTADDGTTATETNNGQPEFNPETDMEPDEPTSDQTPDEASHE